MCLKPGNYVWWHGILISSHVERKIPCPNGKGCNALVIPWQSALPAAYLGDPGTLVLKRLPFEDFDVDVSARQRGPRPRKDRAYFALLFIVIYYFWTASWVQLLMA